jgi:membrane-bound ClpP family serine protease
MAIFGLSPYTWVMIAFLMLLILVLILGDIGGIDFDHDIGLEVDTGLSPLSLPIVASFGTAFGGFGTIFETIGFGPLVTPILAAVFAILLSAGLYVVMLNLFVKSQAETRVDLATLVGYKGQVMIPIRPGQPGQIVVVTEARGRTLLQAISDDVVGTDEHVVVDSIVGNSVKVHKI